MLRLLGFFALTFVALVVLRQVPFIGGLFAIPLVGFYLAAVLVSLAIAWWGKRAIDRSRFARLERDLGQTDTPHNRGKLGSLLLAQGRPRKAVPHLEAAAAGYPDEVDWHYRLGCAWLGASRPAEAVEALERAVELSEEHAYGAALLRLAEALTASGRAEEALDVLARHVRSYGDTPEGVFRRGVAERAAGRRVEARRSFEAVPAVAKQSVRYQRKDARWWVLRSFIARWG